MNKPVYGDPEVDIQANEIIKEIKKVNKQLVKNLSLNHTKELLKELKLASIEAEIGCYTKIQQSIGGHIGGTTKSK